MHLILKMAFDLTIGTLIFFSLSLLVWTAMFIYRFGRVKLRRLTEIRRKHLNWDEMMPEERRMMSDFDWWVDRRRHNAKRVYLALVGTIAMRDCLDFYPNEVNQYLAFAFCLTFTVSCTCILLLRQMSKFISAHPARLTEREMIGKLREHSHGWKRDVIYTLLVTSFCYLSIIYLF